MDQLSQLVENYIELAACPFPDQSVMPLPAKIRRGLKALPLVPVVSSNIPIDPSAQYTDLPHFTGKPSNSDVLIATACEILCTAKTGSAAAVHILAQGQHLQSI